MKEFCHKMLNEILGVSFKKMTLIDFRKLPLYLEGESKEIRLLNEDYGVIYFKPTIYSFTYNRTGIVNGSNIPRVKSCEILCELLKKNGIEHSYIDYSEEFIITKIIKKTPNIEVVIKANHTGSSKHKYFNMDSYKVRDSHKFYGGMEIKNMESYPVPYVRFDWRNPFKHPISGVALEDQVLGDSMADLFIDVNQARRTALMAFNVLSDFLQEKDIVIYDLCMFLSEDGKTIYGEISPDCGRYRHYDLGSLDKDVWRAGGSSEEVVEKWNLLYELISN